MKSRCPGFILSLCCLTGFVAGCAKKPPAAPSANDAASTIGQTNEPITEEEARAFAEKFIEAALRNDSATVNALFDWNALADRCMEGTGLSGKFLADAKKGMLSKLETENSFLAQVNQSAALGGSYRLLHIHEVDGRRRALIRLMVPEGGVNYHDFVLSKGQNGQCRGIDVHLFLSGEFLSTTMKRMMLVLTGGQDRSLLGRLTGQNQLLVKHQDEVLKLINAVQGRNFPEAVRLYKLLPENLQHEKSLMLIVMTATQGLSDDTEYQNVLTNFRKQHPDDACIDFLSIDYFVTKQEYPEALAAIASVSKSVGGDPYLDFMAGNVHFMAENSAEAEKLFQLAVDTEPTLQDGWWSLVTLSMKQENFERTLALLKEIDQKFPIEWADLTQQADYAGFAASPQHAEWLAYLAEKPTAN